MVFLTAKPHEKPQQLAMHQISAKISSLLDYINAQASKQKAFDKSMEASKQSEHNLISINDKIKANFAVFQKLTVSDFENEYIDNSEDLKLVLLQELNKLKQEMEEARRIVQKLNRYIQEHELVLPDALENFLNEFITVVADFESFSKSYQESFPVGFQQLSGSIISVINIAIECFQLQRCKYDEPDIQVLINQVGIDLQYLLNSTRCDHQKLHNFATGLLSQKQHSMVFD